MSLYTDQELKILAVDAVINVIAKTSNFDALGVDIVKEASAVYNFITSDEHSSSDSPSKPPEQSF